MNNIIFYKFEKLNPAIKTRYELTKNSDCYKPLHQQDKNGKIKIAYCDFDYRKGHNSRKSQFSISQLNKHITSLYFGNFDIPYLAYGDFNNDCLLFIVKDSTIIIMILPDKKPFVSQCYDMLCNGDFDEDIENFLSDNYQ